MGDILDNFESKYEALKSYHERILRDLHFDYDIAADEAKWLEGIEYMRGFRLTDTEIEINSLLDEGKSVLAEGAQGTMLDIDHGTYPFVSYYLRRSMYRFGRSSHADKRCVRYLQGIFHTCGRRSFPC